MKKQILKNATALVLTLVMLLSIFPMTALTYEYEAVPDTLLAEVESEPREQPQGITELEPIESLPIEIAERSTASRNTRYLEYSIDFNSDNRITREVRSGATSESLTQSVDDYFFFSLSRFITQPQGWSYLIVDVWEDEILQVQVDMPNSADIDYDVSLYKFTDAGLKLVDSSELWTFVNGSYGTLSESVGWINDTGSTQALAIIVDAIIGFSSTLPYTLHVAATTSFGNEEVDSIFSPRNFSLNSTEPQTGSLDTRADSDWFSFAVPANRDFNAVSISLDGNSQAAGHVIELYTLLHDFIAIRMPINNLGVANVTTGTYFVRVDTNMQPITGMNYSLVVTPYNEEVPPPIIDSVTINPAMVSEIARGSTRQFTAMVQGPNNPPQGVIWSVVGNSSENTTICENGLLSVAANENAVWFRVRATSAINPEKYAFAYVTTPGTVVGNNSPANARNIGRWSPVLNVPTTILPTNQHVAYYRFTANPGDRFYIRTSYSMPGMSLQLRNSNGTVTHDWNRGVVDRGGLLPFVFVQYVVPQNTPNNTQFLIRIERGSTNNGLRAITPAFRDLYRNNTQTLNFSGTATNQGNNPFHPDGRNSTELRLDLRNNNNIPVSARVRTVTTSSQMTPAQGNVRHHLGNNGFWYISTVSSANSGHYNISVSNDLALRAVWTFRYNALATASSSMRNVSMRVTYEFRVTDNYRET